MDQRVRLPGNTRPEAIASNDLGRVPDALALPHLQLLLKRPAEREVALHHYLDSLHDPSSPDFHHWLTAAQFGARFGLAPSDLDILSRWLTQQGFTVNSVSPSTLIIDFAGNAGQIAQSFNTEIH